MPPTFNGPASSNVEAPQQVKLTIHSPGTVERSWIILAYPAMADSKFGVRLPRCPAEKIFRCWLRYSFGFTSGCMVRE